MAGPSVNMLTSRLLEGLNLGTGGLDATQTEAIRRRLGMIPSTPEEAAFFNQVDFSAEEAALANDIFGFDVFGASGGTSTANPFTNTTIQDMIDDSASTVGDSGATVTPTGATDLNVAAGSDFFPDTLTALLGILGLDEDRRQFGITNPQAVDQFNRALMQKQEQFDQTAALNAGLALANLRAQGPQSAAELALAQAGLGLPTGLPSQLQAEGLLGASTRGAGGVTRGNVAGTQITAPRTLTGAQNVQANQNPFVRDTIASLVKAAGDPSLFSRTSAALLPTGFPG